MLPAVTVHGELEHPPILKTFDGRLPKKNKDMGGSQRALLIKMTHHQFGDTKPLILEPEDPAE